MSDLARSAIAQNTRQVQSPAASGLLQRQCACGQHTVAGGECAACKQKRQGALQRSPSSLAINRPGDRYEQEADRVAATVISGGVLPGRTLSSAPALRRDGPPSAPSPRDPSAEERRKYPGSSLPDLGFNEAKNDQHVQLPPEKPETNEDRLGATGEKWAETFLDTTLGKRLTDQAEKFGEGFVSTLPGLAVTLGIAASTIATMALRNEEFPLTGLVIKLPKIAPGLKVKLTYKGPLSAPTGAGITFVYEPEAAKKPQASDTDLTGAETERMAADQAKFQKGTKTPAERAAEQRQLDAIIRGRQAQSGNILGIPGLTPRRDDRVLQRDAAGSSDLSVAPPIVHDVLSSPGQPLDPATRLFMEPRFGHDFSGVRVHTDARAAASARDVNANAYAVGHNIVFGAGQYVPNTGRGARLLAHELAHVVQQQAIAQSPVGIQRYEGPEHQDLGDKHADELFDFIQTEEGKKWAAERKIDAVKLVRQMAEDPVRRDKKIKVRADLQLTPGQIISLMGDFYATWQALKAAPKSEIDQILAVMDKERLGTAKNANAEYETITKGRYTQLARKNAPHFAPKNKEAWKALHVQAIQMAKLSKQENPTGNDDMYQEALGMDAAGGHFLTDAFASGHLMDSTKVQAAIQNYLLTNPIRTKNPEMQTVVAGVQAAGLAVSLTLKNIHDRMNAEGFEVTNAQGMKWRTYGDNHLKNAVETQRVAAYAVFVSRQQINQARNGESPDPNEVLALLPDATTVDRATEKAISYIPQAVSDISSLINRNIGMLDTFKPPLYLGGPLLPFVGKSFLGTISDPGRQKTFDEYDRRKQNDPTTPYPTAPVLRWDF